MPRCATQTMNKMLDKTYWGGLIIGDDKTTCQRTAAAVDEMLQQMNAENSSA